MGCNCGDQKAIHKRVEVYKLNQQLNNKIKKIMAKYSYQVLDSVHEDTRLNFRGSRIPVKGITQQMLKMLYDNGHPQVDRIEKNEKKDDK